jgi:hypothetical protein
LWPRFILEEMVALDILENTVQSLFTDLVNKEFDIQQDINELSNYVGPLKQIVEMNSYIREKISELQTKIQVCYIRIDYVHYLFSK